ncbi:hypothetical protein D6764_03670 [Candidatus Woesearchaeota archaeon]|nr:MAG: hypothetical protein D6764_03670 [Candidatus Woesearchaeota archaeon]
MPSRDPLPGGNPGPLKKRGRPPKSEVRQHITDILSHLGSAYGYEIYKHYTELFPRVTMRLIYYHLKKGAALGIFRENGVKREEGEYSWGNEAEKVYYSLGPKAAPSKNPVVEEYFKKIREKEK